MFDWIKGFFKDLFSDLIDWFYEHSLWIPKKLFSEAMDGLASFIESIPVPDFVTQASGAFGGIPTTVMYFAGIFELNFGIAVVLAAYGARFVLRRIPFIG